MFNFLSSVLLIFFVYCNFSFSQEKAFTEFEYEITVLNNDYFSIALFSTVKLNGYHRNFSIISDEPRLVITGIQSNLELTKEDSTAEYKKKYSDLADITKQVWNFTAIAPGTVYIKTYFWRKSPSGKNMIESDTYTINIK